MRSVVGWFQRLTGRRRLEERLETELRFHFDTQVAEAMRRGMTEEQARRQARLDFGGFEQVKEECRDARGTQWFETTMQDVRFALRTLRKTPGFTLAAVATLALGIGANTAMFSVINAVVLRALPYADADRLVEVNDHLASSGGLSSFSYPGFLDCARDSRSFQALAAWRNGGVNLTAPGEPEFVRTRRVSAPFLAVLGVKPILGRSFLPEEDRPGAPPVAIIAASVWRTRFESSPEAIGRRLVLNGKGYTVVGVLPEDFNFFGRRQVLTPIGQDDDISMRSREFRPDIQAIGRLKPGVTLDQARADVDVVGRRVARQYPDTDRNNTFGVMPLKQAVVGDAGRTLWLLAGVVGLVLLIACANVANLFLARSLARDREFAIRAALGAGRGRLIRQLLSESIVLSLVGGAVGLVLAVGGARSAVGHLPDWLPRTEEISPDGRVLLFTLAASVFTGILFGLAPALRRRFDTVDQTLRQGARGTVGGARRLQSGLVMAEVALAVILLMGAGLMVRSLARLWSVNPGFDTRHLLTMEIALSPAVSDDPERIRGAWQQILDHVRNVPGVEAAAIDSWVPLGGDNAVIHYWTGAAPIEASQAAMARVYTPSPDYLRTMKIPLLRGRFFTERDRQGSEPVAVIDELLAQRAFHGVDPVGHQLSLQIIGQTRIVGVLGHVKSESLAEDDRANGSETVYVPYAQIPDRVTLLTAKSMMLMVRTSAGPLSVVEAVKENVLGPGRDQPAHHLATMEQVIAGSMSRRRGMMVLLAIFGGLALLLTSVGIYGVISYSTSRRAQEIGVRVALGARPGQVLRLMVGQGMRLVLVGIAVGAVASLALTRMMATLLYGVSPGDPLTMVAVVATLGVVASVAIYVPARRAARVDPVVALRNE